MTFIGFSHLSKQSLPMSSIGTIRPGHIIKADCLSGQHQFMAMSSVKMGPQEHYVVGGLINHGAPSSIGQLVFIPVRAIRDIDKKYQLNAINSGHMDVQRYDKKIMDVMRSPLTKKFQSFRTKEISLVDYQDACRHTNVFLKLIEFNTNKASIQSLEDWISKRHNILWSQHNDYHRRKKNDNVPLTPSLVHA